MTIDALPTAPNRNMTPEAFVAAADAWVAAMSTFASQVNADLNLILNLSGLLATSVTSVAIGTGSKSFTVETSKAYLAGQSVRVYSTASPTNYMLGTVTSYDAGTGALVVNVTSVGGSGTLAAWTVVLAASGEWLGNATTATLATSTNRVDSGMVTVASHATTADIFAAASNTIDWTGTATTTAFPAAPKAGMTRTLYCAGACAFTAGVNLLIEGFESTQTATMAVGAIVQVTAITTTQFKITYSLSGTFTITAAGFSSAVSTTAYYSVVNGVVSLRITPPGITGTSNATTLRLSGLPAAIGPANAKYLPIMEGVDNGSNTYISAYIIGSGGLIDLFKGFTAGAWTASGTKTLLTSELTYHLG